MSIRFIVEGADKHTGSKRQLFIDADNATEAVQSANREGLYVATVRVVESDPVQSPPLLEEKFRNLSPAHLLLLSKFREGDSPLRYRDADYWKAALKETAACAIERFISESILEPAELPEVLNYKFKATELKALLKQRGLKLAGRKEEAIQRLILNDPAGMTEITKDVDVYRCTAISKQLAEAYLASEKAKKESAEAKAFALLAASEYAEAVRVMAQHEANQVFARGIGVDWSTYDGEPDTKALKAIFDLTPEILDGIEAGRLAQMRPAAGMMLLWGTGTAKTWLPMGFETGIRLDGDAACRMLVFHANHLRRIEEYRAAGFVMVEVSSAGDDGSCAACRRISGRQYAIGSAPQLPYGKCTCGSGCRCMLLPV